MFVENNHNDGNYGQNKKKRIIMVKHLEWDHCGDLRETQSDRRDVHKRAKEENKIGDVRTKHLELKIGSFKPT